MDADRTHAEFTDPRLVPVYDTLCGWSAADDFFLSLAQQTPDARVLDLGCGTGRLTLALVAAGHAVTGIDPARASLEAAAVKPGAERVLWKQGTAASLPTAAFDLAVMTSHVAQFLTDDHEWAGALAHLRRSLVPGGRLAFDTRDPGARGWEAWNPADSRCQVALPGGRQVETWTEVVDVTGERVSFVHHYCFADDPADVLASATMRFRSEADLRASLHVAGFEIEDIFGGWNRERVRQGCGEFIVVARARA
ncbi:class I SAM-dependent methyltransferase [Deinococcus ruber]|uniref:Methyltransferase type 11 n=1 Tax=Deinococcus ruber TaxID=1848197 RepID=A0A918BYC7_9DEIO|nr:class I SAM-dependent methyltransferase [Deinococcus ruber]GGQ94995.1 methyltransferase type 11 [Deinococcus ruber]